MTGQQTLRNHVKRLRKARELTQAELAALAGISRTAVTAIEGQALVPSVAAALSLARALGCTVEELFGEKGTDPTAAEWSWPAPSSPCRYWHAEVGGCRRLYPVESTNIGEVPHDGVWNGKSLREVDESEPERVLVVATCDPAIGLLAAEYARQTRFRMLPLTRSSRGALDLMKVGKVHAAGVHLSRTGQVRGNASSVRNTCGTGQRLLRIGVWHEGIAFATHLKLRSAKGAVRSRLNWVGREAGSGARQCLDELLGGAKPLLRMAPDHRSVALAIRCGWAEAGVCVQLASEEAGLSFLNLRREAYDLCFPETLEDDPRVKALVAVVQSARYRRLLEALPGYEVRTTGELRSC